MPISRIAKPRVNCMANSRMGSIEHGVQFTAWEYQA